MRVLVLLSFAVAACSSGGGYIPGDLARTGDMAVAPGSDLSMAPGDMAVPAGSDLSMAPGDMAAGCGMLGQPCCGGTMCSGLSTCNGATCGPPQQWSISSLRQGGAPQMTAVSISGAVVTFAKTAGANHGFFVQDPNAASYGGIYLFVGAAQPTVNPGDVVSATGIFDTFRGIDEVDLRTGSYQVTGNGPPIAPRQTNLTTLTTDNRFQSMVVYVSGGLTAVTATDATGAFTLTDQVAQISVTSFVANDIGPSPFPATAGQTFTQITGLGYADGPNGGPYAPALAPRSAADVQ
jgi:hypothetical protein